MVGWTNGSLHDAPKTYPMTAKTVSIALEGAYLKKNLLTSFECIFLVSCLVALGAEESPAEGGRLVGDAPAATGRERREMNREEVALRKVKANTVAAVACSNALF